MHPKKKIDGYLWLNDDTMLFTFALSRLIQTFQEQLRKTSKSGISVGSCHAPLDFSGPNNGAQQKLDLTYGGRDEHGLVLPKEHPVPVSSFNGNLVLVSREAFEILGNLSPHYRHSFGDIDYGIRATQAGVPIWLAPGFLAECPRNPVARWRDPDVSFWERWREVRTPKGWSLKELRAFAQVRGKRCWILSFLRQAAMVCFPSYALMYQKKISEND